MKCIERKQDENHCNRVDGHQREQYLESGLCWDEALGRDSPLLNFENDKRDEREVNRVSEESLGSDLSVQRIPQQKQSRKDDSAREMEENKMQVLITIEVE